MISFLEPQYSDFYYSICYKFCQSTHSLLHISVLVMANAQICYNGQLAGVVEAVGYLLLYSPPFSPDLNPIKKGGTA